MALRLCLCLIILTLLDTSITASAGNRHSTSWWPEDSFDDLLDLMESVDAENCHMKEASELELPYAYMAQIPVYNQMDHYYAFENRTSMWLAHDLALNRAFFYSFVLAKLNTSAQFHAQPGLLHHYMSTAADVLATPDASGSGLFYDNNACYANWYVELPFNTTLPLFGPRTWSDDCDVMLELPDFEPTFMAPTVDYGAGADNNYTLPGYKTNPWYDLYLPDDTPGLDSVRKWSYVVNLRYEEAEETEPHVFFGPVADTGENAEYHPVLFTPPYFDCGRSNKWLVSAASPIVDHLPRYLEWFHLRRHK